MKKLFTSIVLALFATVQFSSSLLAFAQDNATANVPPTVTLETPAEGHTFAYVEVEGPNKTIDLKWLARDANALDILDVEVYVTTGSDLFTEANRVHQYYEDRTQVSSVTLPFDAEGSLTDDVIYTWGVRAKDSVDAEPVSAIGHFTVAKKPASEGELNNRATITLLNPNPAQQVQYSSYALELEDNKIPLRWQSADADPLEILQEELYIGTNVDTLFTEENLVETYIRDTYNVKEEGQYDFTVTPVEDEEQVFYWGVRVKEHIDDEGVQAHASFIVLEKEIFNTTEFTTSLHVAKESDKETATTSFYPQDIVWFELTVANPSENTGRLEFATEELFDVVVKNDQNDIVWNYGFGKTYAQVIKTFFLTGETSEISLGAFAWDLKSNQGTTLAPGTYTVEYVVKKIGEPLIGTPMTLTIVASDVANNRPTVTLNAPVQDFSTADDEVTFTYTVTDDSTVAADIRNTLCIVRQPLTLPGYTTQGPYETDCTRTTTGTGDHTVVVDFSEYTTKPQQFTWYVQVEELNSVEKYTTTSAERTFYLSAVTADNEAPIVSLVTPLDGTTNLMGDVTLSWTASDPENDPFVTELFFVEGQRDNLFQDAHRVIIPVGQTTYAPETTDGGVYYWAVRITETLTGRSMTSSVFTFSTQINRDPNLTVATIGPADITEDSITVRWVVTDADGDDTTVTICYGTDGDVARLVAEEAGSICISGVTSPYTISGLDENTAYYITLYASDGSNPTPQPITPIRVVTAEQTLPEDGTYTTLNPVTSPALTSPVSLTWTGQGTRFDLFLGQTNPPQFLATLPSTQFEYQFLPEFNGTYYWTVRAMDTEGQLLDATNGIGIFDVRLPHLNALPSVRLVDEFNITSTSATLLWNGTDPDEDDELTYTVCLSAPDATLNTATDCTREVTNAETLSLSGLEPDRTYTWTVRVSDGIATRDATNGPLTFDTLAEDEEENTLPVFESFTITNPTVGGATFAWEVEDADGDELIFDLCISPRQDAVQFSCLYQNVSNPSVISNLTSGTTYFATVRVFDGTGYTYFEPIRSFQTAGMVISNEYPVVTLVSASDITSSQARLSWVANDAEGDPISFRGCISTNVMGLEATCTDIVPTELNGELQAMIRDLQPSTRYYWTIFAKDPIHNEFVVAVNGPLVFETLGTVTLQPTAAVITDDEVTLSWIGTGERFELYVDDVNPPVTMVTSGRDVRSFTMPVTDGVYYWTVVVYNASGVPNTATNGVLNFTVGEFCTEFPNDPACQTGENTPPTVTMLDAISTTPTSLTFYWNGFDADGDELIYTLCLSAPDTALQIPANCTRTVTNMETTTVTGLEPGSTYQWTVRVNDGQVDGTTIGGIASVDTLEEGSTDNVPPVVHATGTTNITNTSATFAWTMTDVDGNPLLADVCISADESTVQVSCFVQSLTTTTHTVTNLEPGTTYYWTVRASDGMVTVYAPEILSFTTTGTSTNTLPEVTLVETRNIVTTGATLVWDASDADGDTLTHRLCTSRTLLGLQFNCQDIAPTALGNNRYSHVFTDATLTPNTEVFWNIYVRDEISLPVAAANGPFSFLTADVVTPPTNTAPTVTPGAVTNGTHNSATFAWTGQDADGDTLTYRFCISQANMPLDITAQGACTDVGSVTSYTVSNLQPYSTYHWTVLVRDPYVAGTTTATPPSFMTAQDPAVCTATPTAPGCIPPAPGTLTLELVLKGPDGTPKNSFGNGEDLLVDLYLRNQGETLQTVEFYNSWLYELEVRGQGNTDILWNRLFGRNMVANPVFVNVPAGDRVLLHQERWDKKSNTAGLLYTGNYTLRTLLRTNNMSFAPLENTFVITGPNAPAPSSGGGGGGGGGSGGGFGGGAVTKGFGDPFPAKLPDADNATDKELITEATLDFGKTKGTVHLPVQHRDPSTGTTAIFKRGNRVTDATGRVFTGLLPAPRKVLSSMLSEKAQASLPQSCGLTAPHLIGYGDAESLRFIPSIILRGSLDASTMAKVDPAKARFLLWNNAQGTWTAVGDKKNIDFTYRTFELSLARGGIIGLFNCDTTLPVDVVTPEEPINGECLDAPYKDIAGHWSRCYVGRLFARGAVTAYLAGPWKGLWRPDDYMTRAELLSVVMKLNKISPILQGNGGFADVDAREWYAPFIATASSRGWVKGYEDGNFRPNAAVTREEALKMIMNVANNVSQQHMTNALNDEFGDEDDMVGYYQDVPETRWSAAFISFAHRAGVVNGKHDLKFYPEESISRAELAKMVVLVSDIAL